MATAQADADNAAAPLDPLLVDELDRVVLGRSAVEPKRGDQQIRFLAENLIEAISPSDALLVNPASAKAVIDTGGASIVRGAGAFVRDMSSSPRVPRMVDPDALKPGRDLAPKASYGWGTRSSRTPGNGCG